MAGDLSFTACPLPFEADDCVQLSHGSGGRGMQRLLEQVFLRAFRNPFLDQAHDAALLPASPNRLAFTSDAFVVKPLFFPGGDIGKLAVYGTVNDLAMSGAKPLYLSAGFILEEGLSFETLCRVVDSMQQAAQECGVTIVTGDTKVVERGKGDGVFIHSSGIGSVERGLELLPRSVCRGDAILLSGDIGRHGMAVMACREGLEFETALSSDLAPLASPILALLRQNIRVHCLRDLTRGGLAAGLHEVAKVSGLSFHLRHEEVPVCAEVRAACELLGIDPLHVANEGRFAAWVEAADADRALAILRAHPVSRGACLIGEVAGAAEGRVVMSHAFGSQRLLDLPEGELLPRIC